MTAEGFFRDTPLWGLLLLLFFALALARELGSWAYRRLRRLSDKSSTTDEGYILSVSLSNRDGHVDEAPGRFRRAQNTAFCMTKGCDAASRAAYVAH